MVQGKIMLNGTSSTPAVIKIYLHPKGLWVILRKTEFATEVMCLGNLRTKKNYK